MDISDLNLSVRTFNSICRVGIKTVPELYERYQLHPEGLLLNIGNKGMAELGDALAKHRDEVFAENAKAQEQAPELKPGDYLIEYDPEIWGDPVTFDELAQMDGQLVVVNDAWYPEDTVEEDGEGEVMRVLFAEDDAVILDNDEPEREKITRQEMDDSVSCRYCTKVWKVKGSEEISMNEETKPAVVLENPGAHARAYFLRDDTKARLSVIEENYYAVCNNMKEMRDGKLYKELGYQNFEDCCQAEFELKRAQVYKYIGIAEHLPEDFVYSNRQIGVSKLSLLAMLDEPTREAVTETVDVESVTVKELREQISVLTAERDENEHAAELLSNELDSAKESLASKDKQFRAAMDSKQNELDDLRAGAKRRTDTLISKIQHLQEELEEAKAAPQEVAVEDTSRVEELQKQLAQAQAELAAANAKLAERPMVQEALPSGEKDRRNGEFRAINDALTSVLEQLCTFLDENDHCSDFKYFANRAKDRLREYNTRINQLIAEEEPSCQ